MANQETNANTTDHSSDELLLLADQRTEFGSSSLAAISDSEKAAEGLPEEWATDRNLNDSMLKMFDDQLWTDVTFRCTDQSIDNPDDRVRAHKIVLAGRSKVFQAMLFGVQKDSSGDIEIENTAGSLFRQFLRLLYGDNVDLVEELEDLVPLYEMSHKYEVHFLVNECSKKLAGNISVDKSCLLIEKALLYKDEHLTEQVSNFIDRNAEKVLSTSGFLQITLECLTYILKGNTFYANEANIFNRTMEWAKQRCESTDGQALRKTLGDAFYYLRTPTMTPAEFSSCTRRKGFYSFEEHEDLIDTMGNLENTDIKVECNDQRKRYPMDLIGTPTRGNNTTPVTSSNLYEMVSLIAKSEVYLSKINVGNFRSARYEETKMYTLSKGQERINISKDFNLEYCPLSIFVSISLDGQNVLQEQSQHISGYDPLVIELKSPYLMSAGKTYALAVCVGFKSVSNLQLRANQIDNKDLFTGLRSDIVSVQPRLDYRHQDTNLINSLVFITQGCRVNDHC